MIAYALSEALEPSGWLAPVADIAAGCGAGEAETEEVLAIVQTLEPEGVFARDLAECFAFRRVSVMSLTR